MIVFINPDPDYQTPEQVLNLVIENLLYESDWTQLPDAPVDRQAWAAYRQQLRDFPATWTPGPTATFPTPPTETE